MRAGVSRKLSQIYFLILEITWPLCLLIDRGLIGILAMEASNLTIEIKVGAADEVYSLSIATHNLDLPL